MDFFVVSFFWKEGKRGVINLLKLGLQPEMNLTPFAFKQYAIHPTKEHDDTGCWLPTLEDT